MSAERVLRTFTVDEYLTLERASHYRSEWVDGQIYAMSGGTPTHAAIAGNITGELHAHLRETPCQTFTSDLQVGTAVGNLYTYPDVTVVCSDWQYHDGHKDVILNPNVIFEVLSPSTADYDRGQKFLKYQSIVSLTDYVLVAQDVPRVEHFTRLPDGSWQPNVLLGLEATLHLTSIAVSLPLRDIYDRISFPDE